MNVNHVKNFNKLQNFDIKSFDFQLFVQKKKRVDWFV